MLVTIYFAVSSSINSNPNPPLILHRNLLLLFITKQYSMLLLKNFDMTILLIFIFLNCVLQLGSVLSIHGCCQHRHLHQHGTERMGLIMSSDREHCAYVPPIIEGIPYPNSISNSNPNSSLNYGTDHRQKGICFLEVTDDPYSRQIAGFWGYLFQIVYQVFYFHHSVYF